MAFDMYVGDRREVIHEHETPLFTLAAASAGDFPQLNALWSRFYSDSSLYPEQAQALVHELLALHARHGGPGGQGGKGMAQTVLRLAAFFSAAACAGRSIRCSGD
ncbi:hypothetical protein [Roseateles amylovorans]|uniref:Uncharacterized protein n=1 Tax=Roseateles amylovorans TaxID=2978473 RepID=A0ABY6B106_9BURK|nr:hypothetical protein [Roseateles amylovorans]UXH79076.1 hypothetical protein N4261_03830 [Roseateles amylovorans]